MKSDEPLDRTARGLLEAADREYTPSAADRSRVRMRLSRALSPALLGAGLSSAATSKAAEKALESTSLAPVAAGGLGLTSKAIVGAVLIGSAGFGSGYLAGRSSASPPEPPPRSSPAHSDARSASHNHATDPKPAGSALPPEPPRERIAATTSDPRPPEPAGSNEAALEPTPDELEVQTPALWQETQLLRRAQVALRESNARLAAALLDQLQQEFPEGKLVEERAAARVLTDCALGQVERARTRASEFLARYPSSVHAARVRDSCAAPSESNDGER